LLEAIYLLANNEDKNALSDILNNRFVVSSRIRNRADISELPNTLQIFSLFRGYKLQTGHPIIISSQKDQQMYLECSFAESRHKKNGGEAGISLDFVKDEKISKRFLDLEQLFSPWYREKFQSEKSKVNKQFVATERLDQQTITNLWEQIIFTPKEDMVLNVLRILEPDLERIALVSQITPGMSVLLKLKGNEAPVPLGSMGDGMYRIFALALTLVNCENGDLFVDEIDTGLHYKALTNMWRLVIETAKRLNVQVFATTHSWDCIAAFQKALHETSASELGTLFRLDCKQDQIKYVAYTGEKLATAIEHDIEVR
jgi:AAA15 family ATPase/GTPase